MKYDAFISLVEQEVRSEDAWPTDSSKIGRQIELSYLAALAVMVELPLSRLTVVETSLTLGSAMAGNLYQVAMPSDMFDLRNDFGINRFEIDGRVYLRRQGIPVEAILHMAENGIFNNDVFFSVDPEGRHFYFMNPTTASVYHAKLPAKPADGDVSTADYPLEDKDAHRAVQVVAFHLNGVTIRDTAAAQFNALLEKQYGEPLNRAENA